MATPTTRKRGSPAKQATAARAPKVGARPVQTTASRARRRAKHPSAPRSRTAGTTSLLAQLGARAAESTTAATPLIGIRGRDLIGSAGMLAKELLKHPQRAAKESTALAGDLRRIVGNRSELAPDPKDRRFADPAWRENGLYRRWIQAHMAVGNAFNRFVDGAGMEARNAARARFVVSLAQDALAPSNTILNPSALKRAVDTRGASVVRGLRNLLHDLRRNGGLPTQVDRRPFKVGENLATTAGAVVFRTELFELIQYRPTTPEVHARPLLFVPPQINKFYVHDLSPDKSIVQLALGAGVQTFIMSWRNPTREQAHFGLDAYVEAIDQAIEVAREITRSRDVNLWGSCSGGITMSAFLAEQVAKRDKRVASATVAVCVLDIGATRDTTAGLFITPETVAAAKMLSRSQGVLDGRQMAGMFAWMRPNDLVWNYWVNNYLLGNDPPAFDILYWNNDTTRLPAQLHADLLDLIDSNPFVHPRRLKVRGTPIDMKKVDVEAYVVAGSTDHITPWTGCYRTARLYGPRGTFIVSNSGHIQSLLNPPGNPKAFFVAGPPHAKTAEAWLRTGTKHEGSWWPHWRAWIGPRSGPLRKSPGALGSKKHPPLCDAPGEYVRET